MALADVGLLDKYLVGVPSHPKAVPFYLRPLLACCLQSYAIDIDPEKVIHNFSYAIVRRFSNLLCSRSRAIHWALRGAAIFDRAAARYVETSRPDIVVCYERGALEVFRVAKKLGISTVLDAASVHHAWQDRHYQPVETDLVHKRVVGRKDAELALADHVLTVSEFARETYLEAGLPAVKVTAITIGVDTNTFLPKSARRPGDLSRIRFVYVGNASQLKGLDVLGEACRLLDASNHLYELTMIGVGKKTEFSGSVPNIHSVARLSHRELAIELRYHDVLVLPSRFDSFGMVVAEAMASGLPVIVTENVGAKEMVTPNSNGLIVPAGDAAALKHAMQWIIKHRDQLPLMSVAARASAEQYDWTHYRERTVRLFRQLSKSI